MLRARPGTGKTFLAAALAELLGDSAVPVDGRAFVEANQSQEADRMFDSLAGRASSIGNAQLIFDNYDRALKRSMGGRLQSRLVSMLIDGPQSTDLGAIFFSRYAGPIHIDGRGSPLISRSEMAFLPRCSVPDVPAGTSSEEVATLVGDLACYLDQLLLSAEWVDLEAERLRANSRAIVDDLWPSAAKALATGAADRSLGKIEMDSLRGLLTDQGLTQVAQMAEIETIAGQLSGGWPAGREASARHFAHLLEGHESATWIDRYLLKDLSSLVQFLVELRSHTPAKIRILASDRPNGFPLDKNALAAVLAVPGIEIRRMNYFDMKALHDRHLFLPDSGGGWVVPTADVISSVSAPGSAVSTSSASFGVDYEAIWRASSEL